ncbi:peroxisome assembly protein 10-A-like [Cylas formicarius]|uniref:peroxisome assembly protein 10-A-like n=1 Tax=Cylas formicarius TaxID=197179 RepID=UPI0029587BB7|nr:peroxisome assembly protein 10-A-like [Cylas formicarius]
MSFYEAQVADILRCNQRDENFVNEVETRIHSLLRQYNTRIYHRLRESVSLFVNAWYYVLTSFSNIQTLGEEYTGIIRISHNAIPSRACQAVWLALYIGGEPMLDRFIIISEKKIKNSSSLTQDAKDKLLQLLQFIRDQKQPLKRLHHSLFYIDKKYYSVPNRLTSIRYALLRQWMHDDTFSGSFNILGRLTIFYTLFTIFQNLFNAFSTDRSESTKANTSTLSTKGCIVCSENIENPTATPCGHIFCWNCIHNSLSYQKICPLCREAVIPNRVVYLQNYI